MNIFRRIYRKDLWGFSKRWQCACLAPVPRSTLARIARAELGYLNPAQASIFTNPTKDDRLKNGREGNSSSIEFGIKGCYFTTQTDVPVSGVVDVPLAQTGEGIAECELLKWFVQEGDQVEEFQPLCEVQSDKATIEITSRYKGTISEVLHVPSNIVKVGETLLRIVVEDNTFPGEGFEVIKVVDPPSGPDSTDLGLQKAKTAGVLSTPAVRSLAKQLGVNIEDVCGSGKEGRVSKEDVLNYAAREGILKESSASSSFQQNLERDHSFQDVSSADGFEYADRIVPLRGFHRAMAKSMALAAKIPHFYYVDEINCDSLIELKQSFQNENSDSGVKHTLLPVLIKSLSLALTKYPMLNSSFNEELQEVILKGSHNIGVAMATPNGLVVPSIKKVQSLSILQITKDLSRLQELAKANKLTSDDISGGTITLSNIGSIGGKFGSPLINVPEVSIIAMGRIQKIPQFDENGNVYPASVLTVNIGSDHRVLDGATVARFCNEWKRFIEKPELLLLYMR